MKTGATVIVSGNVYHFGATGGTWSENSPPRPNTTKGEIRCAMERRHAASEAQTIVLRASNFIDTERQDCVMGMLYLRRINRGKIVVPGPPQTRQAMWYLEDWARATVALAEMRIELGQFEDIPFPGHTVTALHIKNCLERLLGKSLDFTPLPWWLFKAIAPFSSPARGMNEMRYLYYTDHSLSDAKFNALLPGFEMTSFADVMRQFLKNLHRKAV